MTAFTAPLGRVLLSLIFILAGVSKLGDLAGTGAYMQSAGVPSMLALPAGLFELLAGLAIAVGFKTRPVALLLAGFCLLTTLLFHSNLADQMQMALALKNVALAGAFLLLFAQGAGPMSLDARNGSAA
jgi:putative oxidoreductase